MNIVQYLICATVVYLIIKRDDNDNQIVDKEICRNCGMSIDSNLLHCPNCNEEVKKICNNCGRTMDIDWRFCPFCRGEDFVS